MNPTYFSFDINRFDREIVVSVVDAEFIRGIPVKNDSDDVYVVRVVPGYKIDKTLAFIISSDLSYMICDLVTGSAVTFDSAIDAAQYVGFLRYTQLYKFE